MENWYTLHTKPNSEHQVAVALRQRGLETYLPEMEDPKTRRQRKTRPFFPCYLFVKVDFEQVGLSRVQWTPGLRRVVAFDDQPVPVPEEVITLIRQQLGEIEAAGGWPAVRFKSGEAVRITAGPFKDMVAIFERPTSSAERVQVLLDILGRASRTEVATTDLQKASPQAAERLRPRRPRRSRGRGRPIRNQPPDQAGP